MRAACAEKVFGDHGESSRIASWPRWEACLDYMRAGDTLVIRALDRIAGTDRMAIEMIRELGERGIKLRSLTEPFLDIDATTVSNGVIAPALFQEETEFVNAGFNPFTGSGSKGFSTSKSAQGVSAKFSGTLHKKAKFAGFNNTWRIDATGGIAAGRSNAKKNTVVVTFNSCG